jgi:hypothetical protein
MGHNHSQRFFPAGYVVWNRRIASARSQWRWSTYMGPNPHTTHMHVSVSQRKDHYVGEQRWGVSALLLAPLR